MNRNDFNRIIQNSASVDRQMMGEVRELLDLFPYFQSAHLLLLKGLHNISDVKFESQLKQSALYIADREVLYHLINQEPPSATVNPDQIEKETATEAAPPDSQQVVIESGKNSQEIINQLSSSGSTRPLLVNEESDEDDSGNIVFLLDDDEEYSEEKVVYRDPSIYMSGQDDLLELDLQENLLPESGKTTVSESDAEINETLIRRHKQAELIDKFIIANPRIEPVRDKSDHPVEDISKSFTEDKGSFVTETLAKIYINQGYFSKAIDIYEKLSLKFPEKSSYFATQIEKVKELIK